MNHTLIDEFAPLADGRRGLSNWVDRAGRVARTIETWRRRQRTRAQLAGVDAHILRDAGISEADRFIESNKPFWEA
jgi:uncharacterized protein YjiS (DUF1127 family)